MARGLVLEQVARALKSTGNDVYSPTLTGLGERAREVVELLAGAAR